MLLFSWQSLFPIYSNERRMFSMLLILFSLISFNYSLLRTSKDVFVLSRGGSEILSALKLYFVLPSAVIYTSYYSFLCSKLTRQNVFVAALLPFLVFYLSFILIFYPYQELLQYSSVYQHAAIFFSPGTVTALRSILACFEHWPFSLYYVMSELWGSVAVGMLFWGLSNSVVTLDQSKRFYALLGIGANVGLIFSGPYIELLAYLSKQSYDLVIAGVVITFVISFGAIIALHAKLYQGPLKDLNLPPYLVAPTNERHSLLQPFKIVAESRQLILIALIVICYGFCINMVEIVWKTQVLKYFYENQSSIGPQTAMQRFFSHTNALTGLFSVILILFVSRQSEKRYGWTITALLTPTILLFFAIVFYITSLSLQHHSSSLHHIVGDPLLFLILLGAIQNIFSKAAKYSLFDPTKEKAYFSLNAEQRSKGKSAVDIMGARFGKAGGAFVQQLMIIVSGSLTAGFNTLSMLVILVCLGWSCAVILLGRFVQKYQKDVTLGLIPDRPVD